MRISQIMLAKGFGGAERSFVDTALALAGRGHAVQAICHSKFSKIALLEEVEGIQLEVVNAQGKVIETQQDLIGGKLFLRCASPRCRKYTCSAQYRNGKLKNSIQPFENHFNTKHAPVDPKGTLSLFCIAASNALQNCRPAENFPASEAPPLQVQPEVLIKPVSGAQFPANRELSEFGQELSTLLRNKNAKVLDECFHLLMVGLDLVEKVTLVEATFFPEEGLFRLSGPPVAGKVLLPVGHLYLKDSKPESDDAPRSNPALWKINRSS